MSKEGRRCALLFSGGRRKRRAQNSAREGASAGPGGECEHVHNTRSGVVDADHPEEQSDTVVVLRVNLHCPACVTEVTRSLQQVEGVKEVSADPKAEMITVKGHQLGAERLCHAVRKKTGKRCQVLLLTSCMTPQPADPQMQMQMQMATAVNGSSGAGVGQPQVEEEGDSGPSAPTTHIMPAPHLHILDPTCMHRSCSCCSSAPANFQQQQGPTAAPNFQLQQQQQEIGGTRTVLHDASEPRLEIRQQTHAIIYGWPSSAPFPPNIPPAYPHNSLAYQGLLSDENPNACQLM